MTRRGAMLTTAALLLAAGPAAAQGGGEGGGRRGRGGGGRGGGSAASRSEGGAPRAPETPASQIELTGVITAIDRAANRVTIAYDPVDALNWPKGTMPFSISRSGLLNDRKVGERVRFKLESQQIYQLSPVPPAPPPPAP